MSDPSRTLRADLPFRRPAVVLSGAGALGAYTVGVLKTLGEAGLQPAVVAGVSAGAINAVAWAAHAFRTTALEKVWARLTPAGIGLRWLNLMLRVAGGFILVFAGIELVLTLTGSAELSLARLLARRGTEGTVLKVVLEVVAWALVGVAGWAISRYANLVEEWLFRLSPAAHSGQEKRLLIVLLAGVVFHLVTWIGGYSWPHRFSAAVLLALTAVWLTNRPGRAGDRVRGLLLRLMPETQGRGLWRGRARRLLLERLVAAGDPGRLAAGEPHLILCACALDSARVTHFVNWKPDDAFQAAIAKQLGEVVVVRSPAEVMAAAAASSAMPVVFEPVRVFGKDYVDAGGFSNQPIHAVLADEADAAVVVLVSPSQGPKDSEHPLTVVDLIGRLLELANWRDLESELSHLPAGWSRDDRPARLCVVEPDGILPGGLLRFDPANARELMRRGERDAWTALDRAGWLEPLPGEPVPAPAHQAAPA
ncbi:MAG TPA: patatin-like phospholipase family protein [Candidatus Limnocylindria bacterium]|nr:patatin-like phospholipase family protein [Candidatus Limnocylindria bacterium]